MTSKIQQYQEEVLKQLEDIYSFPTTNRPFEVIRRDLVKLFTTSLQGQLKVVEEEIEKKKKEILNEPAFINNRKLGYNHAILDIQSLLQNK